MELNEIVHGETAEAYTSDSADGDHERKQSHSPYYMSSTYLYSTWHLLGNVLCDAHISSFNPHKNPRR